MSGRQQFEERVAGLVLPPFFFAESAAFSAPEITLRWVDFATKTPAVVIESNDPDGPNPVHVYLKQVDHPSKILSLRVQFDSGAVEELPALSGKWTRVPDGLKFTPEFPLTPGLKYEAAFRSPDGKTLLRTSRRMPKRDMKPRAVVSAVYPSSDVLPENLLKFYLHFSHPMSRGDVYRHITLLDAKEQPIELPFLEIGEELWDPEQRRLTLLIDPGRIKRGVRPLEDIGPAIESGKRYTLQISRKWNDARGVPLKSDFLKPFRVGPPDRSPPNPVHWHLTRPEVGTRDPLKIRFPESLDHALASRAIWIDDANSKAVMGEIRLENEERLWSLKPDQPWMAGKYHLRAELILEDLAGNSIGRPFEVDVFNRVDDGIKELPLGRSFKIGD